MFIRSKFLFPIVLATLVGQASAYTLNPCLRVLTVTGGVPSQEAIRIQNACGIYPQFKDTVHEHMTLATIQTYGIPVGSVQIQTPEGQQARTDLLKAPIWKGSERQTISIIKGAWWNDDPLMYLWGEGWDFIAGVHKLGKVFKKQKRAYYAGGTSNCEVKIDDHLPQASHYGALQHLHFMTTLDESHSAKQRVDAVTAGALVWMEFTYKVATGAILPTDPLTPADEARLNLPSIAKNLCLNQPNSVKVRTLFARTGDGKAQDLKHRNQITPDVALGSMLHLIQDSFSPAHTCRVPRKVGGATFAVLQDVHNYNEQDHNKHAAQDVFPLWFKTFLVKGEHLYSNDPVAVGAWLIGAVDQRMAWDQVRDHLMSTIFAVSTEVSGEAQCV